MADDAFSMTGAMGATANMALNQGKASAGGLSADKLSKMDPDTARKAAEDFEATFISQMMQQMFSGLKTNSMFGGGQGEEMFRSMLLDEYGKQVVRHGGLGIADQVMNTLLANQEKG